MPLEITLSTSDLFWIIPVVHFSYAFVTHFHWLLQLKHYEKRTDKQISSANFFLITFGRFLLGLEVKIVETILVFVIRTLGYILALKKVEPWKYQWHVTPEWSVDVDFDVCDM